MCIGADRCPIGGEKYFPEAVRQNLRCANRASGAIFAIETGGAMPDADGVARPVFSFTETTMQRSNIFGFVIAVAAISIGVSSTGCATAPKTQAQRLSLVQEADAAVQSMIAKDESLRDFLNGVHGYAVFPNVA